MDGVILLPERRHEISDLRSMRDDFFAAQLTAPQIDRRRTIIVHDERATTRKQSPGVYCARAVFYATVNTTIITIVL